MTEPFNISEFRKPSLPRYTRPFTAVIKRFLICLLALVPTQVSAFSPFSQKSESIRQQIQQLEGELKTLPVSPVNTSPWTLGFSSSQRDSPEIPVEIEIRFPEPKTIDLVALLPATYIDDRDQLKAFGFPQRFSIERILPDGSTQVIADYLENDYPEPSIEPQLFPCPKPVLTAGLRIIATQRAPNPTWWKATHIVALSEVFAFEGDRNIALNAEVEASSAFIFSYVWAPSCITDGFSLFSPIDHNLTNPMANFTSLREEVTLELDLGEMRKLDEFHLWPVVHSIQHNFPASSGIGFPESMQFELATKKDFSDARVIYEEEKLVPRPGAGPYMRQITPASGRYLRLTLKNGLRDFRRKERVEIALSEIEFLEKGHVVSRGLPVIAPKYKKPLTGIEKLTDGLSNEGRILPLRQWLTQFKRRVELEGKLAALRVDLDTILQQEDKLATRSLLVAVALIVVLLQVVWLVRVAARRRGAKMRERIACDLHDEIGANVSSIAHTAELLDETITEPSETQSRLLTNLVDTARLTSRETKHFVRFIEGEDQDRDLSEQFGTVANQILGTIPTKSSYQNISSFNRLDPSTKWNLLLFFKETLNNIIKHAGATAVEINTKRAGSRMQLEVSDNGRGMPEDATTCRHLESRAKMLGGQLEIRSRPGEGTRIILTFKRNAQP